ncbi:MAG TPA: helix-turn-helix domain-containing protein [Candidatus Enterenecus avicola]|nr:helix-turn-helix domain-containing protein [Candidatus Enterenecus avicola]
MEATLGKRIAALRRDKGLKQDDLAQQLGVTPQAVSKWENDQTCPDITLLPQLAQILGVSVDELLSGKAPQEEPPVKVLPVEQRKDWQDMVLRIVVDSADGDKVRVNLPLSLVEAAIDMGADMSQVTGSDALKGIDLGKILELVRRGSVGNLVEVDSADGDIVRIFVE